MLTVHRSGSQDPCPGKSLIQVETTDNPSTDYCTSMGDPDLEQVWVDSNTPSIATSYAANNPIFTSADCTVCAPDGFYKDVLQPLGPVQYYYFKGCNWNQQYSCDERPQVTIRGNTNQTNLCNGIGILQTAYLDVNYTPYGPFTTNSIYTTHGLYDQAAGTASANIPYQYYSTTNPAVEQQASNIKWTRFWTANFGQSGGTFGTPTSCGGGGEEPIYYSVALRYNLYSPVNVCDSPQQTYYLEDGDAFEAGSTLWTTSSANNYAPQGFYVSTAPFIDDGNGRPILQITGNSGVLVSTDYYCSSDGDPRQGPGGFE